VVAIGGNALAGDGAHGETPQPLASRASRGVADLVCAGRRVVVTHGNGPQVGEILLRSELLSESRLVQPLSLETSVAQTEGDLGHLLSTAILAELASRHMRDRVACILTHTVVSATDAGFRSPSKPIGPAFERTSAENQRQLRGWVMVEEPGRGFRRVVPSPHPLRIVEIEQIRVPARAGYVVIAAGDGGIPVVESGPGIYEGTDAVIDKDRASAVLAAGLGASFLIMSTGVERIALSFGRPDQRYVDRMTVAEAERSLAEGQFPPGSMGPKVEAAVDFISQAGQAAVVTSLASIGTALE
jgi:carbamate kinase